MADLNSKIILVNGINIDRNYVNVLSYTENQMVSLCEANAIATANDYSFIRKRENSVQTSFSYNQCLQANYIAFQNKDYSNKWFFAFIDDVIYNGENNTEIKFTIDSWSTWFSYWTKKPCYVIREHVNDDTIGLHTILENIEIGDVIEEGNVGDDSLSIYRRIAVLTSYNPAETNDTLKQFAGITVYTRQIFGKWIFLFENLNDLAYFINHTNRDGHISDIQDMFYIPNALINDADLIQYTGSLELKDAQGNPYTQSYTFWKLNYSNTIEYFNTTIPKQHSFSGFTPKNNKCFVFPYNYLLVTNNNGNNNIYKYEDFYNQQNCVFRTEGVISVGNSIQCVPLNYRNMARCDDEAIPVSKYPSIAWSSDAFTNWLTQNGVNMQTSILNTILGLSFSALGGLNGGTSSVATEGGSNMIGAVGSGVTTVSSGISRMIGMINYANLLPNIQKGNNNGDINFQAGRNFILFRKMRVKNESLEIIDNYFTRFGYKIVKIKEPNITGRTYWNYVEIRKF